MIIAVNEKFFRPVDINNKRDMLIQEAGRVSWTFYKSMVADNHSEEEAITAADDLFETIVTNGGLHGQYA
jgi:hypothetical protein